MNHNNQIAGFEGGATLFYLREKFEKDQFMFKRQLKNQIASLRILIAPLRVSDVVA